LVKVRLLPSPKISHEVIDLTLHILDIMAGHFDPSQFTDEFEMELRNLVKRKAPKRRSLRRAA